MRHVAVQRPQRWLSSFSLDVRARTALMIRAYKYLFYKLCLFERVLFDPVPGVSAFCFMLPFSA